MFLPGRLNSTTLGDVLGGLHRTKACGELELIGNDTPYRGCHHWITMRDGLVCDVRTVFPVPAIGEVLVQQGILSDQQHQQFIQCLPGNRFAKAGELLVRCGFATPDDVSRGLYRQSRLRLEPLFALRDAELRFHPLRTPTPSPRLTPDAFLHGRERARNKAQTLEVSKREHTAEANALRHAYQILGLPPNASHNLVRSTFRNLALHDHPDIHTRRSDPQHHPAPRFATLVSAYQTILAHASPTHPQIGTD